MQLLLDCNNLIHRAYHALLATDTGEHIHALVGLINMILSCIENYRPNGVHLAWDSWPIGTNLRLRIYDQYKATRDRDSEVYIQIQKARQVLELAGFSSYYAEGYEADDILATLVDMLDDEIIVISNDADLMALASNTTAVTKISSSFANRKLFYRGDVFGAFQLWPEQIVDFKSLRGDVSDNIKGCPGIGEIWAKKLLRRYDHLGFIYETIDQKGQVEASKKINRCLIEGREQAWLSYQLCSLMEAPLTVQSGAFSAERIHEAMKSMGISR